MTADDVARTVLAWHDALNRGDIDALLALSSEDVAIEGPRGTATGHDVLRDWVARANITLDPRAIHISGAFAIVEQTATWQTAPGTTTDPVTAWSLLTIGAGRITSIHRYETAEAALARANLEVLPPPTWSANS